MTEVFQCTKRLSKKMTETFQRKKRTDSQ